VLVGIVDSGIDYTHPDFRNTDGTSRIAWLWDQTISPEKLSEEAIPAQPPKGYVIGAEYDNAKINEALSEDSQSAIYRRLPSRDLSGHGTHVAGIAAGNGRASDGDYAGVAPKSTLIVVKLASPEEDSFPSTSELLQAVNYCVSKALSMRMPLALNLSFGNTYGSHAGTSLVERFFDDISNYWKTSIVIGMGNEGAAAGHTSGAGSWDF
jgi:subtilisin family serine protease